MAGQGSFSEVGIGICDFSCCNNLSIKNKEGTVCVCVCVYGLQLQGMMQSTMAGKAWQQELEATGHTASKVGSMRQLVTRSGNREINAGTQLAFFVFSPGPQPRQWYCISGESSLLNQLNLDNPHRYTERLMSQGIQGSVTLLVSVNLNSLQRSFQVF